MKIIEPNVELWQQGEDAVAHVAKCARVCYRKEEVNTGNDKILYDALIRKQHLSMFRHESIYAIVPTYDKYAVIISKYSQCPYIDIWAYNGHWYIATNQNFMLDIENATIHNLIIQYQVTPEYFANTEFGWGMMRYTFYVTTQISTSRELNRVSPNSIAEQSTRYVLEDGTICRPHWLTKDVDEGINPYTTNTVEFNYAIACALSFDNYKQLIEAGVSKQDARGVLPLDTATHVVYTYSVNEWKHIIKLRAAKNAHPNAQIIANKIKNILCDRLGYEIDL